MSNKDDDERFWNFLVYKIYATDAEMSEMAPTLIVIFLLVLAGLGIWYLFF
jgi:hypothetical protein